MEVSPKKMISAFTSLIVTFDLSVGHMALTTTPKGAIYHLFIDFN